MQMVKWLYLVFSMSSLPSWWINTHVWTGSIFVKYIGAFQADLITRVCLYWSAFFILAYICWMLQFLWIRLVVKVGWNWVSVIFDRSGACQWFCGSLCYQFLPERCYTVSCIETVEASSVFSLCRVHYRAFWSSSSGTVVKW